ncbi:hypothetical protein [Prosthecodimorpha staleyi]|uniref:Uncharacterized protein n=1 Tax=Prosthecodimorpha staleyi TaxID=2840188 RepID=A0A947D7V0_9HYPH|nr:hypothetical protein [Prosthecodimorpha staleyi]MBT9292576.1 hypothetical protein [Prosthecodimorpha staleyi]
MMIMVFTACAILAGDCREIVMPLSDDVQTPFRCMQVGQFVMAEWQREHGAFKVAGGWRCMPPSRLVQAI